MFSLLNSHQILWQFCVPVKSEETETKDLGYNLKTVLSSNEYTLALDLKKKANKQKTTYNVITTRFFKKIK